IREREGLTVVAVNVAKDNSVTWPTDPLVIEEVLLVKGRVVGNVSDVFFAPRQNASTARVFGVVDQLLSQTFVPTRYIDVGSALLMPENESLTQAFAIRELLLARNPVVLGASAYDVRAFWLDPKLMQNAPYIFGSTQSYLPLFRNARLANHDLVFTALPNDQ